MSAIKNQKGFLDIFASLLIGLMASLGLVLGAAGAPSLNQNAENTARQTDASVVLSSAAEYMANNAGKLPTQYVNGKLTDGSGGDVPSDFTFSHYTTLSVKSGAQLPMDKDELWLVTGAQCASEDGGTVSASSRSAAVLYAHASGTGFEPKCRGL